MSSKPLKILFAIAEAYPFIKVGGLADVGASLPKALARLGHDVRLVLPGYTCVGAERPTVSLEIPMGPETELAHVDHHGVYGGVSVYTVGNESYFDREAAYGGYEDDDVAPFVLFSKAVVAFAARSEWKPDIIHCNDWHLGLVPQYVRYGPDQAALGRARTVLTIHNLAYQGHFGPETEALAGLQDGEGSMLARGIAFADAVNTVSRSYLEEILTVEHGMGMDGLLRSRMGDLYGILNGVDYEEFTPATDPHIAARYDGSFVEGKRRNKAVLQELSGLEPKLDSPLIGMVARLVDQKGLDLLCSSVDEMTALDTQVVIMGRGDEHYERTLEEAASRHNGAFAYHATSEEALARQVYAGSDFFLAPSTFEPCGLGPLIALRYGSIPIARRTGGLAETIRDQTRHPDSGLGFTFGRRSPRSLVKAVRTALEVYSRESEWKALQERAMGANFSWENAAREYERLYARVHSAGRRPALARTKGAPLTHVGGRGRTRSKRAVPLALVHHANQYLITDGYDNREGITEIVEGYAAALRLHEKYGIPASLHLSGTLIETLAWHYPWFLELVRALREKGLISLIGGTYSENVMPLFEPSFNSRQLEEFLWLYRRHLRRPPEEVEVCWVPERVWDTEKLAATLTSSELANGGYRFVLLDDRLLYSTNGSYAGSPRARFDAIGPFNSNASRSHSYDKPAMAETYRTYHIAEADGLVMVPISANLRYWVPPSFPEHWRRLGKTVESLSQNGGDDTLLVYADDLEMTAGVGGWDASALARYDAFLRWVASREDVVPVLMSEWLAGHPPQEERSLEPGTFFEVAQRWEAGEDYRGWWESAAWSPYRERLAHAQKALRQAQRESVDRQLLDLAWKHLLACTYETAWYDSSEDGSVAAPWAKAVASHARACLVMVDAARWFAKTERPPSAEVKDIDEDGEDEVILKGEHLYAVIAPEHGGRLIYLFTLTPEGGVLVVGNPTDDWNFQEELNRYMDIPPNHPGALSDAGFEHDRYLVSALSDGTYAWVEMTNVEEGSRLFGTRKSVLLAPCHPALAVCYRMPEGSRDLATETCLAPDYYRLLREGRRDLSPCNGESWRGFRNGEVAIWLGLAGDEATGWTEPARAEAGHGMNVRVQADTSHFHLLISCGDTDEDSCQQLLQEHRAALDEIGERASTVHLSHDEFPAARRRPIRIPSNDLLMCSGRKGARG
jgi:ADP-glucose type glycogen/starch synthase